MTTRPGIGIQKELRFSQLKRLTSLVRIVKKSGAELNLTTHDRPITHDGVTYEPLNLRTMDDDVRAIGLRVSNVKFAGLIDGETVTVDDMWAEEFDGAKVWISDVDWSAPWRVYGKHRKSLRAVLRSEKAWSAQLVGLSAVFERPRGGRFGGIGRYTCAYSYGDPDTCRKDISADVVIGARVSTVIDERMVFTLTPSSYTLTRDNDYYREGEMKWMWSWPSISGTVTSTTTATTLVDTSKSWTTDELVGRYVRILTGTNGPVVAYAVIIANSSNTLYYVETSLSSYGTMSGYTAGQHYDIAPKSENFGRVSPIIRHINASRYFELLIPTAADIIIADSGILKPGCNGLATTCQQKSNMLNFGGRHLQPRPSSKLEAAR